jgi:hypothetical protein
MGSAVKGCMESRVQRGAELGKPKLLDQMRTLLRLKHYSLRTEQSHVAAGTPAIVYSLRRKLSLPWVIKQTLALLAPAFFTAVCWQFRSLGRAVRAGQHRNRCDSFLTAPFESGKSDPYHPTIAKEAT